MEDNQVALAVAAFVHAHDLQGSGEDLEATAKRLLTFLKEHRELKYAPRGMVYK
jgi:hypothetical protein